MYAPCYSRGANFMMWLLNEYFGGRSSRFLGKGLRSDEWKAGTWCFIHTILELHGYVPDSSLELEHLMLKTQNHGNRFGAVCYAWPIPTPARMREVYVCVCVKKEMNGAATAYWVEKDYPIVSVSECRNVRSWFCFVSESSPSTCILVTKN